MRPVIFTDLDGTLLDFHDYSYQEVEPLVRRLQKQRVPIIFCSSKTRVEQEYYRNALGNTDPFIVENGSAIYVPQTFFSIDVKAELSHNFQVTQEGEYLAIILGKTHDFVIEKITTIRQDIEIDLQGYADLSLDEIMEITQLDREFSQRASTRDFSETLLTGDKSSEKFMKFTRQLEESGLSCVSGGKYHTVMGQGSNKGKAVEILTDLFKQEFGEIETIGLGDSANDLPLLAAVDKAYLVQRVDQSWLRTQADSILKVKGVGPKGWVKVAESLISV